MRPISNYIDFRNEHRIYFVNGLFDELVGMIALTDPNPQIKWGKSPEMEIMSPETYYKLILNSKWMHDGGTFLESNLPPIFAHRGDELGADKVLDLLIENINHDWIGSYDLLVLLENFDLKVSFSEKLRSIELRLFYDPIIPDRFLLLNNVSKTTWFFFQKGDRYNLFDDESLSIVDVADRIAYIIDALRKFFNRDDIMLTRVSVTKDYLSPSSENDEESPHGKELINLVNECIESINSQED